MKTLDIDNIIKTIESYGFTIESDIVNSKTPIILRCLNGHVIKKRWNDFQQGKVYCHIAPCYNNNKRNKFDDKYMRNQLDTLNFKVLDNIIETSNQKINVICEHGKEFTTTYNHLVRHKKCPCLSKNKKYTLSEVKKFIESTGNNYISGDYKNAHSLLVVECQNGHLYETTWNKFQIGYRCPLCKRNILRSKFALKYEDVKRFIENIDGYKLISTKYINNSTPLQIQCPEGHIFEQSLECFKLTKRCPHYFEGGTSKMEKEIVSYIKSIYCGTVIENDRSLIMNPKTGKYLELDIWMPEISKAIEYNGKYWHSSKYSKYKDFLKQEYCKNNNIYHYIR